MSLGVFRPRPLLGVAVVVLLGTITTTARAEVVGAVEADRRRVQEHLAEVERELRAKDVSHLTHAQRAARERNLDRLREYREAGVFPRNDELLGERTPVFIDDAGRECAMAHLILRSGATEAAHTVAREENLARVVDIESVDLGPWLEANGMTLQEAQRVQPSYCFCENKRDVVCGDDGITYFNRCVAEECRYVDVAHEGACEGDGGTGGDGGASSAEPVKECVCKNDGGPFSCYCGAVPGLTEQPTGWAAGSLLVAGVALVLACRRRR